MQPWAQHFTITVTFPLMVSLSNHEHTLARRHGCRQRRSSFDRLRMSGVEGLTTNGDYVLVIANMAYVARRWFSPDS